MPHLFKIWTLSSPSRNSFCYCIVQYLLKTFILLCCQWGNGNTIYSMLCCFFFSLALFYCQASNFFHTCGAIVTERTSRAHYAVFIWLLLIIYLCAAAFGLVSLCVLKSRPILSLKFPCARPWFDRKIQMNLRTKQNNKQQ